MPDTPLVSNANPPGNSKTFSAILAAVVSSYCMTKLSLNGVNFETMGVSSELVKSLLVGSLVGFFAWLTPRNFVGAVRDIILFVRDAFISWRKAAKEGQE